MASAKNEKPQRAVGESGFEATPRQTLELEISKVGARPSGAPAPRPKVSAPPPPALSAAPMPSAPARAQTAPLKQKQPTPVQQAQHGDAFGSYGAQRKRANLLGSTTDPGTMKVLVVPDRDWEPNGTSAPRELTHRDGWKAVQAPITSAPGERSRRQYERVLLQFAVAHNPRYREDGPGRPRGHLFVWDVSRAMGCEIPHFTGAQELSLAQTMDWVRRDAPDRGWHRLAVDEAFEVADQGQLVIVMPKEVRLRQLAIVPPQRPAQTPLVTGAGLVTGASRPARELLGSSVLECFTHP